MCRSYSISFVNPNFRVLIHAKDYDFSGLHLNVTFSLACFPFRLLMLVPSPFAPLVECSAKN